MSCQKMTCCTHALFPQPNGVRLQNCAGIWELVEISVERICYHVLFKVAGYDDGGCESESQCSMCNFVHPPRATLRGLCTTRWTIWEKYYLIFCFSVGSMSFTHFVGIPTPTCLSSRDSTRQPSVTTRLLKPGRSPLKMTL